jgi:hypothetical protein
MIASPFLALAMPLDVILRVTVSGSYGTGLNDSGCTKQLVKRRKYHCFAILLGGGGMRWICRCTGAHLGVRNLGLFFFCQQR